LSGNATDRGGKPSKTEVEFCSFDGSLGRVDLSLGGRHGGFRRQVVLNGVVENLLARCLLLRQRSVAFHIELGAALNSFGVSNRFRNMLTSPREIVPMPQWVHQRTGNGISFAAKIQASATK